MCLVRKFQLQSRGFGSEAPKSGVHMLLDEHFGGKHNAANGTLWTGTI
ncbi:hypothetical protein [Marinilabilia rubra]|nr:hypothetical protein [Marinilabilia rubra]